MKKDFLLIPAIDLMDGQCVRLTQGRADQKQIYSDNPPEVARGLEMQGAQRLHIVDLDGAFAGKPANLEAVRAIRERVKAKIEVGGGLRSRESVKALFDLGVDYAILGTRAIEDPKFLKSIIEEYGEKIIVGVDAANGKVATKGWIEVRELDALAWAKELEDCGVSTLVYTDIARDGMLGGPNLQAQERMAQTVNMSLIASGGVSSIEDILALAALPCPNLIGVIVGKAIYDGKISVSEAVARLGEQRDEARLDP